MSLYPDPLVALIDSVNTLNNVKLTPEQYTFGVPEAFVDPAGVNNTRVTITAKDINSPLDGSITLNYKRLDLADIAKLVVPKVGVYLPSTTLHIAQALNESFGLSLGAADIVRENLTTLTDGAGTVTLTALPGSYGWIGSLDVEVMPGGYPIADYLKVTRLPGLNYPSPTTTKPYGAMYSYWRDFSARETDLARIIVGNTGIGNIQSILREITKDDWILTGAGRYSLDGARVTYTGATSDNPLLNTSYTHAVVVALTDQCQGLSGDLILHYNITDTTFDS